MDASFISFASIFLPMYSGVRPIISPAMNTPRIANIRIVYSPVPTPPGASSPSCIRNNGTKPPSGVMRIMHGIDGASRGAGRDGREQCRGSDAKARLLALHVAPRLVGAGYLVDRLHARCSGLPCCSLMEAATASGTSSISIAASSAQPWRVSPTMLPKV